MKIPTANVLVAFNRETMDRLFSSGATYKSLVAQLSEGLDNALLFDNVANPNFVSFDHSLGLGGGMKMTLTFIDPKGEFERRFFTDNPAKLIQGFSDPKSEKTEAFITTVVDNKDVKESQKDYENAYIAQYKQELQASIGSREIYVAYGMGNNLDLWSGPHRTMLTNANIDIDGARKITLTLTPTANTFDIGSRRGAYNEKINLNLQGLKIRTEGTSQEIKFSKENAYNPVEYLRNFTRGGELQSNNVEINNALKTLGYEELSSKLEKFDFHSMVVDALRNYVAKATNNKNVIVLLPNLNVTCRQAINDEARKFNIIDASGFSDVSAMITADLSADVVADLQESGQLADVAKEGAAANASNAALIGSHLRSRAYDLYDKVNNENGKDEMFVESTLKAFGLRLHTKELGSLYSLFKEAQPTGAVNTYVVNEAHANPDEAFESFYQDRMFTAVIDQTTRELPDHLGVLQNIINNIRKLSQESYKMSSLAVMDESDIKVVDVWKERADAYTFAGYDKFNGDHAVIVGDLALIKEYLYGGVNLEAKAEAASELRRKSTEAANKIVELATQNIDASALEGPTPEDYELAAATQIPLHPLDKLYLADKEYNKTIREIVNPVLKGVGAFGDISYIPDDFAYQDADFSSKEREYIEENGIPVFRYNTQNPNIIDVKFNFGAIYFSLLKMGYQKEIGRLTSAVAEGVLPTGVGTFPIRSRGAAIAYLRSKGFSQGMGDEDKKKVIESLATRISPELAKELEVDSAEAGADSFANIIKELEDKNLHSLVLVDQALPGNPNAIMADFSEELYRKALQMSITTLPLFHISKLASISSPCIVFAQDQPILQSRQPEQSLLNKFFSGLYKIMGFKHTITTTTATSEFKLVKNAPKFKKEEDQ